MFHDVLSNHNKIGDRLCRLRKEKKLTQEELAEKLEVTRQTIWKWEAGITFPDANKIGALCKIFDIDADYFFKDKSEKKEDAVRRGRAGRTGSRLLRACRRGLFLFLFLLFTCGAVVSGILLCWPRKSDCVEEVVVVKLFFPSIFLIILSLSGLAVLTTVFIVARRKKKKRARGSADPS